MELQDVLLKAMDTTAIVKPRAVTIPGWPAIYVRAMTVAEAEDQAEVPKGTRDKHLLCRGVARVLCDAKGGRVLDPDNEAHIASLSKQPWTLLQRILSEIDKLNGLSNEAVENLGKNSPSEKSS